WVELRHEERVVVPELALDDRAAHLLEAEADQLAADGVEELPVRVAAAAGAARRRDLQVVGAELVVPPGGVAEHLRGELGDLVGDVACFRGELLAELGEPERTALLLAALDAEGGFARPTCELYSPLPLRFVEVLLEEALLGCELGYECLVLL